MRSGAIIDIVVEEEVVEEERMLRRDSRVRCLNRGWENLAVLEPEALSGEH